MQFNISKLRRAVDADEEIKPIVGTTVHWTVVCPSSYFSRLNLGNINVKLADGIGFERLLHRLVAGDFGQSADIMPLETTV